MRLMKRNLRSIWYQLYQGKTPVLDDNGWETGETEVSYSNPVEIKVNVSPAVGNAQQEIFGTLESYDKIFMTDNMSCPVDENSVLFIDRIPEYSGTTLVNSHDYIVKRVAKSLNHISYGVTKVNVYEEQSNSNDSQSGEHTESDPEDGAVSGVDPEESTGTTD